MEKGIIEHLENNNCDILWDIETHAPEWYEFRKDFEGTGGSGAGVMLDINQWRSKYEQFHYDAGMVEEPNIQNETMFWGTKIEPTIREIWRYIDLTNFNNYPNQETPLRNIYDINKYILNSEFKRLYASPDGIIPQGEKKYKYDEVTKSFVEDGVLGKPGVLEIKKISSYAIKKYGGIPTYYKAQVQQYLLIMGMDYAEIVALIDGSKVMIEIITTDTTMQQMIVKHTDIYWNKVIKVKSILSKVDEIQDTSRNKIKDVVVANRMMEESANLMLEIEDLLPPVDNSESVALFMKNNYVKVAHLQAIPASDIDKAYTRRWNLLQPLKKRIEEEIQLIKNNLHAKLFNKGHTTISLGEDKGKIYLQARGNADKKSLYNGSKKSGDEKMLVEEIIKRMNIYEFE